MMAKTFDEMVVGRVRSAGGGGSIIITQELLDDAMMTVDEWYQAQAAFGYYRYDKTAERC